MSGYNHPPMNDSVDFGVIIIDHGSRRAASNELLVKVARNFAEATGHEIVEPAHMELAPPSLGAAFDRCVARGAKTVVIHPYFLLPGRHWSEDIPALAAEAAANHPGVRYLVTAPLGLHPLMAEIIKDRVDYCVQCASGEGAACSLCADGSQCRFRRSDHDETL